MNRSFQYFTIVIFLLFGAIALKAQENDANITGDVQSNGEHVPFINVYLKGTTIGTMTDATGHFNLVNLPEGEHTIVAKGIGYKEKEMRVSVVADKTQEIKFDVEEDILGLDEVVISADRTEINRKEAPVIVNSISPKLFESTNAVCISDGLDFTPGVRMECNCSNCGFSQVRMNGLDGPYSQILINSRPIFSGLAGVYGLELIPANMVERIEVVRGGGSALFGGNAIAGTVNIITKEPKTSSFSIEGKYGIVGVGNHEGTEPAQDRILNINGSAVTDDLKSGVFIYGHIRNRDPFDENGDDFSEMVLMENTTFGLNAYHKLSNTGKLSLDLYRINEFRRGGNKFDYLPHEADITEQVDHVITGSSLTYDLITNSQSYNKLSLYAAAQQVDRESYYGAEQDPSAYGQSNDLSASMEGQYTFNMHSFIFAPATMTVGVDNNLNKLEDIKLGANDNPNNKLTNQMVNTLGTFIQNDWKTDIAKLSLGLRFDNYIIRDLNDEAEDISGSVLAPRANILFNILPTLRYRISYAQGYRAPQIFDEDLHIEASGSRRITHKNDADLKQETSHSFTTSINTDFMFGSILSEFVVEGFYTKLIDPFANEFNEIDGEGNYEYIRMNAESGAYVTGTNIEFNSALSSKVQLQLGFTLQKSEYEEAQAWGEEENNLSKKFMRTPDKYGFMTLDWHPTKKLDVSFNGTYTGSMYVPHFGLAVTSDQALNELLANGDEEAYNRAVSVNEAISNGDIIEGERLEKSEDFLHLGFRIAYTAAITKEANVQFHFGIQNIFNQSQKEHDSGVYRDAGYIYGPCKPRTFVFGMKFGNIF